MLQVETRPSRVRQVAPTARASEDPSNFRFEFYTRQKEQGLDVGRGYIERDVRAFWAESLKSPSVGLARVNLKTGEISDEDGRLYSQVSERAATYWRDRGNESFARRFAAEGEGIRRAGELVVEGYRQGVLPFFVIGSSPGEVYRKPTGEADSMFYIYVPGEVEGGRADYEVYTIPTAERSANEHWELLRLVGDVDRTYASLQEMSEMSEITPESVVALPVILDELRGGLNKMSEVLGFRSFSEVKEKAEDLQKRSLDGQAEDRVEYLISRFTSLISQAVERGDIERGRIIEETMRRVVADEAGVYLVEYGGDMQALEEYLQKMLQVVAYKKESRDGDVWEVFSYGYSLTSMDLEKMEYDWMMRTMSNPMAMSAYSGSGCGAGGNMSIYYRGGVETFAQSLDYYETYSGWGGGFEETVMSTIAETSSIESDSSEMKCVTCPFCKETVDAIVTVSHIECPKCHEKVSTG